MPTEPLESLEEIEGWGRFFSQIGYPAALTIVLLAFIFYYGLWVEPEKIHVMESQTRSVDILTKQVEHENVLLEQRIVLFNQIIANQARIEQGVRDHNAETLAEVRALESNIHIHDQKSDDLLQNLVDGYNNQNSHRR